MATEILDVKHVLYKTLTSEFQNRNLDIGVTRAYPKSTEQLKKRPIISISRVSGTEEMTMISDLISPGVVENNQYSETLGYLNQEIYEIGIWTLVADIRDDLLVLTRQIFFEKRLNLAAQGFQKFILVGCSDEEVDVSKLPAVIYRGVLRFLVMSQVQRQTVDELVQAIVPNLAMYTYLANKQEE